jgi:four helix bundle protein
MTPEELKTRTFNVALATILFVRALPRGPAEWKLGGQLLGSGTSVAAQYRAACRAQSTRDFIAKLKKLEEEADESGLWLALLRAGGLAAALRAESVRLEKEFSELTAIAVASIRTARRRERNDGTRRRSHREPPG